MGECELEYSPVIFLENLNSGYHFSASQKHSRVCLFIFLLISIHFLLSLLASPLCVVYFSLGERLAVVKKSSRSKGEVRWTEKWVVEKETPIYLSQSGSAHVRGQRRPSCPMKWQENRQGRACHQEFWSPFLREVSRHCTKTQSNTGLSWSKKY